jgi:SNF2 family DNA or RNA helicase
MVFKYLQLCSRRMGRPVNRFSKKICKMESSGKDEETETNRDLLRSLVQKLPILRKKKTLKIVIANQGVKK